ncbi:MAG: helix-turn-helix domain-containing protein [bacterium]
MSNINDRIKQLRGENDLTQEELAKNIGLSRSTVAGYETNKRKPDSDTLNKIADFFNVSVDFLLGRSDQRYTNDNNSLISPNSDIFKLLEKIQEHKELQNLIELTKDWNETDVNLAIEIIKIIKKFKNK